MSTIIRPFLGSDSESVLSLLKATRNFSAAEISIAEELLGISAQPLQQDYFAFVAVADAADVIQGFVIIGPVPATAGTWNLYWIAVDPAHHGSGVADTLDSFAESFVRNRGGYWLLAETSSQPGYVRARGFYRKQGYLELARIADYYKPSDDMIIYGKRLSVSQGH